MARVDGNRRAVQESLSWPGADLLAPRCVLVWSDGASRGNPGPSGAGAVVKTPEGEVLAEISAYLGIGTNNRAEYEALRLGLERALILGAHEVDVYMDSELVVRQLRGEYRIKQESLKPLFHAVSDLVGRFDRVSFHHLPRAQNAEADALANRGVDRGTDRGAVAAPAAQAAGPRKRTR